MTDAPIWNIFDFLATFLCSVPQTKTFKEFNFHFVIHVPRQCSHQTAFKKEICSEEKVKTFSTKSRSGFPDFSWHSTPKRGKIYQITTTLPNCHK
jgi:hypothetical protein